MRDKGINTPTLHACLNSRKLLYDEFYIEIDTPLVHSYIPLKKACIMKCSISFTLKFLHFQKINSGQITI